MDDRPEIRPEAVDREAEATRRRRQRARSIAIALILAGLVVLFYVITIIQLGSPDPGGAT